MRAVPSAGEFSDSLVQSGSGTNAHGAFVYRFTSPQTLTLPSGSHVSSATSRFWFFQVTQTVEEGRFYRFRPAQSGRSKLRPAWLAPLRVGG